MDFANNADSLFYIIFAIVMMVILIGCLIAGIFYLITLQNALKAVSPENRKMPPGNVWLLFIPLFNLVWLFFVVDAIGISFKREFERYGVFYDDKPSYNVGLVMAILQCCGVIPLVNTFTSFGALGCWIAHWVLVNRFKNELLNIKGNTDLPDGEKSIFA